MATPFTGVIILLMAALAFTACPTEGSGGSGNAVSIKDIQGVTVPQVGDSPVASITPNSQFSGTVRWEPAHPTFQPRTTYKAIITLNPISPNTMQGVPANYFNVLGAVTVRNNANSGLVEAVFGLTGGEENNPSSVTNIAIQGINRPKTGITATKFVDDVQYSGTVNWSPGVGDTFDFGVAYTATVTLTAKRGWTFAVTQTGWSIASKDATFTNIGGGFATVVTDFPMTTNDDTIISKYGIQLSELPRTGGVAKDIKVRDCDEYTATIEWRTGVGTADDSEVWDGRFLPGSNSNENDEFLGPTAFISVFPNKGFTLEGVPENAFYILGVEVPKDDYDNDGKQDNPKNTANRGIVTYRFHKLERQVKIDTIQSVDFKVPYYDITNEIGEIASLVINNNGEYQGTIEWDPQPNTVSKRFESGIQYKADITLTPRKGWTFYGRGEDWFKLPGSVSLKHEPYTGVLKAVFPTTGSKDNDVTIDGLDIYLRNSTGDGYEQGVTANTLRVLISQHIFDNVGTTPNAIAEQFVQDPIGPITFAPNDAQFVAGTAYTATFSVIARDGFTLKGVAADSFRVEGIQARHAADSGIITVNLGVVPKINIAKKTGGVYDRVPADRKIIGVDRPIKGNTAPTKKVTSSYSPPLFVADVDTVWEPALPTATTMIESTDYKNKFLPNTKYTAKIKLKESAQYTLDKLDDAEFFHSTTLTSGGNSLIEYTSSNAILYGTASTASDNTLVVPAPGKPNPSYDKDSKTVTVVFNKTQPLNITRTDDLKLDLKAPVTDNTPQFTLEKEGLYEGTAVWYDVDDLLNPITGKFLPEKSYVAHVDLKQVDGYYAFVGGEAFTAKNSDGTNATVTTALLTGNTSDPRLQIWVTFIATKKALPKEIKLDSLPVTGKVPQVGVEFFNPDGTLPGITFGTVVWEAPSKPTSVFSGRFGSNLVYTAKFRLFIDTANYSLRGLDPNQTTGYFKIVDLEGVSPNLTPVDVEGSEVSYEIKDPDADYLDLIATFKPTKIAIATLTGAELNDAKTIPQAKSGKDFHPDRAAKPIGGDDVVIENKYYTGKITWYDTVTGDLAGTPTLGAFTGDSDGAFDDDTPYVAKITLTAKDDYTFARVPMTNNKSDGAFTSGVDHASASPYFKLLNGKLDNTPGRVEYAKYGDYTQIVNLGAETRSNPAVEQTYGVDDTMVVWVFYAKTQTTIEAATKKIKHLTLTVPSTGTETPVGDVTTPAANTLNQPIYTQYVITKNIVWAGDPFVKGGAKNTWFKDEWTFTGTYTLREVGKYTFKGLSSLEDLFSTDNPWYIVREQSRSVSSGGAITITVMVGYSTKVDTSTPKTTVTAITLSGITPPANGVLPDPTVTVTATPMGEADISGTAVWAEYSGSTWVNAGTGPTFPWIDTSNGYFGTGYFYKLTFTVAVDDPSTHEFDTSSPPALPSTSGNNYLVQRSGVSATSITYTFFYSLKTAATTITLSGIDSAPTGAVSAPTVTAGGTGVVTATTAVWQKADGSSAGASFTPSESYRLKVTVDANAGYDFRGASAPANAGSAMPDSVDAIELDDVTLPTKAIIYLYYTAS